MRADALQPLATPLGADDDEADDDDATADPEKPDLRRSPYSEEEVQEATQFLQLSVSRVYTLPRSLMCPALLTLSRI